MTIQRRFRIRWLLWSLIGLAPAVVASRQYLFRRDLPEQLRQRAAQQGLDMKFGSVHHGLFVTTMAEVSLAFKSVSGIAASIDEVVARQSMFGPSALSLRTIHFTAEGEPADLFASINTLLESKRANVSIGQVDAEYRHWLFGRAVFKDLSLERRDDGYVVRARQVAVGSKHWQDVVFFAHRRNQLLEIGLGDTSAKSAAVQLGYFPSTRGAAQWTLTAKHQPARALGQKFYWDPGPAFDAATIGGSVSLVVPTDPTSTIRGSVQFALDRWPKPAWAEVEPLLGNTASFIARIERSADTPLWNLLDAEVSLSIFSMTGVGRISFGMEPSIALDVQGKRRCAQLSAHLPQSSYSERVKQYLEQPATTLATPTAATTARRREDLLLRLQLSAASPAAGQQHVAWQLTPGCGLEGLAAGNFRTLDLPTNVGEKQDEHHH